MEPQLPAAQASVFLLQPLHVINHVKWQKAQHCQDCEGDLMELKMGCFVVMQSILFHLRRLACLLARSLARLLARFRHAPKQRVLLLVPGSNGKCEGCVYFKQRSRRQQHC